MIVYGERALHGQRRPRAAEPRLAPEPRRRSPARACSRCRRTPNGRGMREAGFAPGHGPGYASLAAPGRDAAGIAEGLASGELHTVWLHHVDPLRNYPNRAAVGARARHRADGDRRRVAADRHGARVRRRRLPRRGLPREGRHARASGRAPAAAAARDRPPARRRRHSPAPACAPLWQVIADVARALGYDPGDVRTGAQVSRRLFDAVPFYDGHHARGDRRPRRALGRARGVRLARLGARRARRPARRARRRATASCGSAPTARCGRPRRSTSRRRCTSSAPARSPSSRRPTPTRSGSARATASRSATAPACART